MSYSAREVRGVAQKIKQLVAEGMTKEDAAQYVARTGNNSWGKKLALTAAAMPIGAAFINMSNSSIQKATELGKYLGLRNPLDKHIIDAALNKVYKRNPEIAGMDRKKVEERAIMLYNSSPVLLEPENTEILENLLLNMRSFNGADYKLLKDVTSVDKEVRSQRQMGATAKDLANIGTLMIR